MAFPRLIGPDYGGKVTRHEDPLIICIRRGEPISTFFLEHRNRAFDRLFSRVPGLCMLSLWPLQRKCADTPSWHGSPATCTAS